VGSLLAGIAYLNSCFHILHENHTGTKKSTQEDLESLLNSMRTLLNQWRVLTFAIQMFSDVQCYHKPFEGII
jgi:hypothetical protein